MLEQTVKHVDADSDETPRECPRCDGRGVRLGYDGRSLTKRWLACDCKNGRIGNPEARPDGGVEGRRPALGRR